MKNYKKILLTFGLIGLIALGGQKAYAVNFYDTLGTRYEGAVERLAELKIVTGVSKNSFDPERKVTRAEFAKMYIESALKPAEIEALIIDDANVIGFKDVKKEEWYYKYIVCAVNKGFMKGYEDGTFKPDKEVTYAEISKMVTLALGHDYLTVDTENAWYTNYVDKMYSEGLFRNVLFKEITDPATRGNVANIIWNMLRADVWKMVKRSDADGFVYVNTYNNLFSHKIIDHILLLNAKIQGFKEINGNIYVTIKDTNYKLFDQSTQITFSMIGGYSDVLLKRVEYPGEVVRYEAVGISTDIGSTLHEGTYKKLKEEGFDLTNKYRLSSDTDYAYLYHNENDSSYSDRAVGIMMNNVTIIKKSKVTDTAEKIDESDKSHSSTKNQFEDDPISYRYEKLDKVFTREIDINEGEKKIEGNALLFKNNQRVEWSSLKEGDILVEVAKNEYYFIASTESTTTVLKEYNKKKGEYSITTSSGTYETYAQTRYLDYFSDKVYTFNSLKDSKLKEAIDKKVRLTFDMSDRVVKIELLEDKVDTKELNMGIFMNLTVLSKDKNARNKLTIYQNGKSKAYNTSMSSISVDPGALIVYTYDDKNPGIIKSVKSASGKVKLTDKIVIDKYKTSDLQNSVKYFDEEDELSITAIKYHYKFGKYENPSSFDIETITISEYLGYKDADTTSYAIVDSEDVIKQIFVEDRTEKSTTYYGVVNKISKDSKSGKITVKVDVVGVKSLQEYEYTGRIDFIEGDFIKFVSEKGDKLEYKEKFTIGVLGYYKDLEVISSSIDSKTKKVTSYNLSNDSLLDVTNWKIITEGEEYNLNAYDVFLLTIGKIDDTQALCFKKTENVKPSNIKLENGDLIAINEIEGTVIIYRGYEKK